jgi:hypothetical protein
MAASMEALYALYSPMWLCGSNGTRTNDFFMALVCHMGARATYDLTEKGQIRSTLTKGQSALFDLASSQYEGRFIRGEYASCNFFIEVLLESSRRNLALSGLFQVTKTRTYRCPKHPNEHVEQEQTSSGQLIVNIFKELFNMNKVWPGDVSSLIDQWTSKGIFCIPSIVCRQCRNSHTKANSKKHSDDNYQPLSHAPDIDVFKGAKDPSIPEDVQLEEHSVLKGFGKEETLPLHLYFVVSTLTIFDPSERHDFMSNLDWPFKLSFGGVEYTLFSRGYYGGSHYWSKVYRHSGGLSGIWLHNDMLNDGYARLISRVPSTIGATSPQTAFLMYSCD